MDATTSAIVTTVVLAITTGAGAMWFAITGSLKKCEDAREALAIKVDLLYASAIETAKVVGAMQQSMANPDNKLKDNAEQAVEVEKQAKDNVKQIVKVVEQLETARSLTPIKGMAPIKHYPTLQAPIEDVPK